MNNILVVNVNWLGDTIFASPVYQALKDNFPACRVSCLAVPRVREILECIPAIDRIMIYDEKGAHRSWWAKWRFSQTLKKEGFDTAIILRPSLSRSLLLAAAGIPRRIGYAKCRGRNLLTEPVPEPRTPMHRSDYYLNVLEAAGLKIRSRQTSLQCPAQARQEIEVILRSCGVAAGEPFIVINPGGNWMLKRWPVTSYVELIRQLEAQYRDKIVLTGAPGDVELARRIQKEIKSPRLIDVVGKTDLKQLMALFQRAVLVISNDSGPLHIANSVGARVIGIFGPTRPEFTGPRGAGEVYVLKKEIGCNLLPCYYLDCPDNLCMKAVKVKDVLETIGKIHH